MDLGFSHSVESAATSGNDRRVSEPLGARRRNNSCCDTDVNDGGVLIVKHANISIRIYASRACHRTSNGTGTRASICVAPEDCRQHAGVWKRAAIKWTDECAGTGVHSSSRSSGVPRSSTTCERARIWTRHAVDVGVFNGKIGGGIRCRCALDTSDESREHVCAHGRERSGIHAVCSRISRSVDGIHSARSAASANFDVSAARAGAHARPSRAGRTGRDTIGTTCGSSVA